MKFLGFVRNFDTMSVYLPGGKMEKIAFHCQKGTFTRKSGIKGINQLNWKAAFNVCGSCCGYSPLSGGKAVAQL